MILLVLLTTSVVPVACGDSDSGKVDGAAERSTTTSAVDTADDDGTETTETTEITEGSDGSDDGTGGSTELSCESIPPEMVEALLGSAPAPAEESMMGVTSCEFVVDDDNAVAVSRGDSEVYRTAFDTMQPLSEGDVAGLGEIAFLVEGFSSASQGGTNGLTLWVDAGELIWAIAAQRSSGDVDPGALEALARQVVG